MVDVSLTVPKWLPDEVKAAAEEFAGEGNLEWIPEVERILRDQRLRGCIKTTSIYKLVNQSRLVFLFC